MRLRIRSLRGASSAIVLTAVTALLVVIFALSTIGVAQQDVGKRVSTKEELAKKLALEKDAPGPEAKVVGWDACQDCHEEVVKVFKASRHSVHLHKILDKDENACEHCHGAGSEHVDAGNGTKIRRFIPRSPVTVKRTTEVCVSCHNTVTDKTHWQSTVHAQADVSCTDCHRFHGSDDDPFMLQKPIFKATTNTAFRYDPKHPTTNQAISLACLNCHTALMGEMRQRSHHPMFEDRVSCTECHEVHRSSSPALLPANKDLSDICFQCHANKRGPFVFEHEPVKHGGIGESCMTCHRPHGSPNPKLLVANGRGLCLQCHTDIPLEAAHQNRPGNCWRPGCHVDIHGSNTSEFFFH